MNTKLPDTVNYNGHGMIERYPKNLSQSYVIAHENRHRNHQRIEAISKGETLSQEIDYKIEFSEGIPVVSDAVTKSEITIPERQRRVSSISEESISNEEIVKRNELKRVIKQKEQIEEDIRQIKVKDLHKDETLSVQDESDLNITEQFALERERNKSARASSEINQLKSVIQKEKALPMVDDVKDGQTAEDNKKIEKENISLRNLDRIIMSSFNFMQREVPGVSLTNGLGSAVKTKEELKSLDQNEQQTSLHTKIRFGKNFLRVRNNEFDNLTDNLNALDRSGSALSNVENYNLKKSTSQNPEVVNLEPSFNSPEDHFSVAVKSLASGGKIFSSEISDSYRALALSGSFQVNGFELNIETTDSLNDIKNKINYGEDINRNGRLDFREDSNSNGESDTLLIRGVHTREGFTGSFFYSEDNDFDKSLDESEDTNNNRFLDGGVKHINAFASIEKNRLFIESITASDVALVDTDGLLKELGFFTENLKGAPLKQEEQLSSKGLNLNIKRSRAEIEVNSKNYLRDTNQIDDVIPATSISINNISSQEVKVAVQKDFSGFLNIIKKIKKSYNDVIRFINDQELSFKPLDDNNKVQNLRGDLIKKMQQSSPDTEFNNIDISDLGFSYSEPKNTISQVSINNLDSLKNGAHSFSGINTLLGRLEKMGVSKIENDTLNIDTDKLIEMMNNNEAETISLLTGSNGVASNLKNITEKALDESFGTISIQKRVAGLYLNDQSVLKRQIKIQTVLTESKSEKNAAESILNNSGLK